MQKFRKKPVEIEAVQLPDPTKSQKHSDEFGAVALWCDGEITDDAVDGYCVLIETLEGQMKARIGDWIIKGVNGELCPCKPDIFEKTYEAV